MPGIHLLSKSDIKDAEPGKRLSDGGGLFLHVRDGGAMYWSAQVTIKAAYGRGKRVELGLGRYPDVSLDDARDEALEARRAAKRGEDPRAARRAALQKSPTFEHVAQLFYETKKVELRNGGADGRWYSVLSIHVLPKIGNRPVDKLHQNDVRDMLTPIWHTKAETARKALSRVKVVLEHAAAMGIEVDMQMAAKAKKLLGKSRHVAGNVPAMPWQDVPEFYAQLEKDPSASAAALRLLILTGLRSKPIRFAHTGQIEGDVWTIPADLMKGRKDKAQDFRVPLSGEALSVVAYADAEHGRGGYLFPGARGGSVISDMAMSEYMKQRGMEARPHGFRTSLRTWLAECTDAPHEVAEMVLAHTTGGKVVNAYRRTDFLEQRAALMERWANFVTGGTSAALKLA